MKSPISDFSGKANIAKNTFIGGGLGVGRQPGADGSAAIASDMHIKGYVTSENGSSWQGTVKASNFEGPHN